MDIQPVLVDQGLLRARADPGGGGGQSWAGGDQLKEGDSGSNEPWDFGEPSTWSEATPPGSAGTPHLGPHLVSLIQILLFN